MVASFSSSVNIIRDENKDLNYIPTPNSKLIYRQIIDGYSSGQRSFNIIGSYGTGKSSFLWALEKHLQRKNIYFEMLNGQMRHIKSYKFIQIIGDYSSLTEAFAKSLDITKPKGKLTQTIFNKLDKITTQSQIDGQAFFIIIDECGKFLEYAAGNTPEKELYFIQQLSEYVNDTDKNYALITTLHQDFNTYANSLKKNQRDEWNKVKGRLKEIPFNEPVEQLLFLAANRIEQKFGSYSRNNSIIKTLFKSIKEAKVYPLNDYLDLVTAKKLFPLDILSASIITKALQQYGQNERSLFSFIESGDFLGLNDYKPKSGPYYHIACVYDYLQYNYFSYIYSRHNPHYIQWNTIKSALNRTENIFDKNTEDIQKLVKTIGVLNIFASPSAIIDKSFLCSYCMYGLGIKNAHNLVKELEKNKIIRYNRYGNKYVLFEGTDLDIDLALHQVSKDIPPISNISTYIKEYFSFPYIYTKSIYYKKGTPRFFEYIISDQPRIIEPKGQVDGYINLIFNNSIPEKEIINVSKNCTEAIIFGKFQNTSDVESIINEIEKIKRVILHNEDDKVAVRELKTLMDNHIQQLNSYLSENLFNENSNISWIYKGKTIVTDRVKEFNVFLSGICAEVYSSTPIFKSELVNRSKLTGAISSARRNLIKAVIANWEKENLGFDETHFPPEKTIYLSLLKNTGIHRIENDNYILANPINEKSFNDLWRECECFVQSSKYGKRNLSELISLLSKKPFKLKDGFIQFWFPIFLFIKRNDFALYGKKGYIPLINSDILDLINKKPSDYFIKAFDLSDVKMKIFNGYRNILNQIDALPSNDTFIETIKPFFIFYRELPDYTRNTNLLSPSAIALRQSVKEIDDPESVFFEAFPRAMGYSLQELSSDKSSIEGFTLKLIDSLREINNAFDALIQRIDSYIADEIISADIDFTDYRTYFSKRYKTLNKPILKPLEKVFLTRLLSPSGNKKVWINSIVHSVMNKPLERFSDDDEIILINKLKYLFRELDNFCELSTETNGRDNEEIIKIEMTSLVNGLKKNLVRLPKTKTKQIEETLTQISKILSKDSKLNIAILVKLLQNELEND